ncbi:MAG TPA: efflux transporter outer membrane subunit [Planctomycetota bacterium]|nr:efflux transporter outer membrane subunit [Planctomycetota bacterium]
MRRLLGVALLAASGCAVGPDYERPKTDVPPTWGEVADTSAAELSAWWTLFHDDSLNSLIDRAVKANLDLRIAAGRVHEARAELGVVLGGLFPEVDLDGSYAKSRLSPNGQPFPVPSLYQSHYTAGAAASWEIDLFGSVQRGYEAATADYDSWIENRRNVLVVLLGDVARNYVGLRGNQLLLTVLRQNVVSAKDTEEITKARLAAGVATSLDVVRAQALRASAESAIPPVDAAIKQSIHRLGVLIGTPPETLTAELSPAKAIPTAPTRVIVGLPSELLRRRPDIRQAERKLAEATAAIGVATAELYPRISLTGSFGLDSLGSADFLKWESRAWSLGPSVRWPIFAGGQIRAQIEVQDAQQEQALAAYERTVLTALEEVENSLVAYLREGERRRALDEAVVANRQAVDLADDLYKKGLTSFIDVLDAQRALFLAQADQARSVAEVTLDLVALYKALGGGWEPRSP